LDGRRFDANARARAHGVRLVGVDEAGRGPWAGPVVVSAVIMPAALPPRLFGVKDSKLLTPESRERFYRLIRRRALAVSVAWAQPTEIDRVNILQATLAAMGRAVRRAAAKANTSQGSFLVLVDGPFRIPGLELRQEAVIDGDAKSLSIGAASIVAKVVRDRWMRSYARRYPGYGFGRHKGYGTKAHQRALDELGPCRAHRRSYAPIKTRLQMEGSGTRVLRVSP
jgi:ribonuclease HII